MRSLKPEWTPGLVIGVHATEMPRNVSGMDTFNRLSNLSKNVIHNFCYWWISFRNGYSRKRLFVTMMVDGVVRILPKKTSTTSFAWRSYTALKYCIRYDCPPHSSAYICRKHNQVKTTTTPKYSFLFVVSKPCAVSKKWTRTEECNSQNFCRCTCKIAHFQL